MLEAIAVGSLGMARWLRHRFAHGGDRVASCLSFPFLRSALAEAAAAILGEAPPPLHAFDRGRALLPMVARLRARSLDAATAPDFATVSGYLRTALGAPVQAREVAFARDVMANLDRLFHDRPAEAAAWLAAPEAAPEAHRWLAWLAVDWCAHEGVVLAPPLRHSRLLAADESQSMPLPLHVFGLSTLGRAELDTIAAIARHGDVFLYLWTPSQAWFGDHTSPTERRRALRRLASAAAPSASAVLAVEMVDSDDNPLLASLGRPSRDLQGWLEDVGYAEIELAPAAHEVGLPAPAPPPTTLARLQRWVADAGGRAALGALRPDASLEFHAAAGALRQVEALRERLLDLFARDPQLQPRDVIVMTPDVGTFAPLCQAVFARRGRDVVGAPLPALPMLASDLGLDQGNALIEPLRQLLALCDDRLSAAAVCGLASLPAVRGKLGLAEQDVAALVALADRGGLRWGADAADRAAQDQPADEEHTILFGLERLALGALLGDAAAPPALMTSPADRLPVLPEPVLSPPARAVAAALMRLCLDITASREDLAAPRAAGAWRLALLRALDAIAVAPDDDDWQRLAIVDALEVALPDCPDAPPLERAAVRWLLDAALSDTNAGDRPLAGGITVCALEPMRSVPFRVVVLLGMDDGAFPRASAQPAWSPFATSRPGERDSREVDRHLLLEAMGAARDRLILVFGGEDARTGKALPAAVPVEELLDVLVEAGVDGARERAAWVSRWPLQPWSQARLVAVAPSATTPVGVRLPIAYDASFLAWPSAAPGTAVDDARPLGAAAASWRGRALSPTPRQAGGVDGHDVDVRTIARDLAGPAAGLLRRLGAAPPRAEADLREREPLDLDALGAWALRQRLLALALAGTGGDAALAESDALDVIERRERGAGALPHGAAGRLALEVAWATVRDIVGALPAGLRESAALPADPWVAELDGWRLLATPQLRDGHHLGYVTVSQEPGSALLLDATLTALVARLALGDQIPIVVTCVGAKVQEAWNLAPPTTSTAEVWLRDLLALWRWSQAEALPIFAHTSKVLAEACPAGDPRALTRREQAAAMRAAEQAFNGDKGHDGDLARADVQLLFADFDLRAALEWELAARPYPIAAADAPGASHRDQPWALALRLWRATMAMRVNANRGVADAGAP